MEKRLELSKGMLYEGNMDTECLKLCDAINSLPGIKTIESCCGHSCGPFNIFIEVDPKDPRGIFFLTRCVDHRYWKYGYLWKIELTIGDDFTKDGNLPTTYLLNSGPIVGEDAYDQAMLLIDNMNHHLNIEAFMTGFKLDINDFKTNN